MSFKKLKDMRLYLYGGVLFSIIIFIVLVFYGYILAYMVSSMILLFSLLLYISEIEGLIKKYEEDHQKQVQAAYNNLRECIKSKS